MANKSERLYTKPVDIVANEGYHPVIAAILSIIRKILALKSKNST